MTDDGRPPMPGRLPVPHRAQPHAGGSRPDGSPRVEIRTAQIRVPGILALLLAIPAFFLFGLLAIMFVVLGAVGMLIGPWMLRRMVRRMEAEVAAGDTTIELERGAYEQTKGAGSAAESTIELDPSAYSDAQDAAAIKRSSSSRRRGKTSP